MVKALYSKEIMRHFRRPQNKGRMKGFSGLGKVGNVICGDVLWLYIKVGKNRKGQEVIKEASFSTFGCTVAIANSSLITTMVKGKTLEQALNLKKDDLIKSLGKVPPIKIHCSLLAVDALAEAVYDYLAKNKRKIPEDLQEKHRRIVQEKKQIEVRYKDWLGVEEKIYEQDSKKKPKFKK